MMREQVVSFTASAMVADEPSWRGSSALAAGFLSAFRHQQSGEVRLCQFSDGTLAPMHVLDQLPTHWVSERDRDGRPTALITGIEAGYLRGESFWTLDDLRHPGLDG